MALLEHRLNGKGIYIFDEPEAALSFQNQLLFYRVKEDGTAEGVICEAIPSNSGNHYYVKSGLKAGDEVVVNGAQKLSNGAKVR